MAAGKWNMQKASGGVASITVADGVGATNIVLPESGTVATTSNIVGFKNYIINGNFDIWQRGNSYGITTVSSTYTADRFHATLNQVSSGTLMVAQNVVHKEAGNNYCLELNAQTLVTTGVLNITQIIESFVAKRLAGKTVTLSVRAKVLSGTSNCSIGIKEGTNIDSYPNGAVFNSNVNITTSYQTFIMQATISQATTSLSFRITTPSAFNGVLYIQNVQLEEGSVATPFENRPIGLELSLCQRYLPTATGFYAGHAATNAEVYLSVANNVEPRVPPTGILYQLNGNIYYTNTGSAITNITFFAGGITSNTLKINPTGAPLTIGQGVMVGLPKILFTGCEL